MRFLHPLAVILLIAATASGQDRDAITVLHAGAPVPYEAMLEDLAKADVVLVGEQHGLTAGHAFEARLLQSLTSAAPRLTLSLEMFESDIQLVLDEYLRGQITESAFLAASRPWPRYKSDYRPLIEWSRAHQIKVVAANVPRRYVNIVSRQGQGALRMLSRDSRRYLPRLPYSMQISPGYEQALDAIFGGGHDSAGAAGMPTAEHMKQAQALWDIGMAESVLRARRSHRNGVILHICGSMHCERGYGITERLRAASRGLTIRTVIIRTEGSLVDAQSTELGDYIVVCPPNPTVSDELEQPAARSR